MKRIFWIELIKIVILGIIEGITEWLPISSTAHMLLTDEIIHLQMSDAFKEMFFVVIQFGAILAVIFLFFKQLLPVKFEKGDGKRNHAVMLDSSGKNRFFFLPVWDRKTLILWGKVLIACIPTGILGFLLDDYLEEHFGTPVTIAEMLILYGILFIVIERKKKGKEGAALSEISFFQAFFIGLFQALSMIPGTSRSGVTILGAILLGISRVAAAEFTFYLAIPTMFGASLLKIVKYQCAFERGEMILLLAGILVAFSVSVLSIRFLMNYIKKHDFQVFGWYRIFLGIAILLLY